LFVSLLCQDATLLFLEMHRFLVLLLFL